MLFPVALGIAIGYGPQPTRRVAVRLTAADPPSGPPFSYSEHTLREQASQAVWNLVVKPAVQRRRDEMSAPPVDTTTTTTAYDAAIARAPVLVPEDAPAIAAAVAASAAATPQEVDAVALAVHELSALAGSEGVPYSASQIVHAFNAWKAAVGRKYNNLDGEALELRAFAGNTPLIAKYAQHSKSPPLAGPELNSCASPGRARRLWAARYTQSEAQPLGTPPPPQGLKRAASKVADSAAFRPSRPR